MGSARNFFRAGQLTVRSHFLYAAGMPLHKNVLRRDRSAAQHGCETFAGALLMNWFAQKIDNCRGKVDMADRLRDRDGALLSRQTDQPRYVDRFLKEHFLSEKTVCAHHVAMVARV